MKSIIIIVVVSFLFVGCFDSPSVVPARVRLLNNKTIVKIDLDTNLYSLGDTITLSYSEFSRLWGVNNNPTKSNKGVLTFHDGIIEKWLEKSPNDLW